MSTHIPPKLIDDLMEIYVDWREECIALREAYERWSNGPVTEREMAFAAYLAALEREEQASAVYADRLHEIEREQREPAAPPSTLGDRVISRVGGLLGGCTMTMAAELSLSEVDLEQIDRIMAGSVPLSAPPAARPSPEMIPDERREPRKVIRR